MASDHNDEMMQWLAEFNRLDRFEQATLLEERLHPDLVDYIDDGMLGIGIKHPLVWSPMGLWFPPEKLNEVYLMRQKDQAAAIKRGKWSQAAFMIASPHRMEWLWLRRREIPLAKLRDCVSDAWTSYELPHQSKRYVIHDLFEQCGWMTDVTGDVNDKAAPPRPPLPPTLYRGVSSIRYGWHGFSWTADPQRAIWFASRWAKDKKGVVYEAKNVPTHRLYAYFTQRGEAEFVINPDRLRNVTKLEV